MNWLTWAAKTLPCKPAVFGLLSCRSWIALATPTWRESKSSRAGRRIGFGHRTECTLWNRRGNVCLPGRSITALTFAMRLGVDAFGRSPVAGSVLTNWLANATSFGLRRRFGLILGRRGGWRLLSWFTWPRTSKSSSTKAIFRRRSSDRGWRHVPAPRLKILADFPLINGTFTRSVAYAILGRQTWSFYSRVEQLWRYTRQPR